MVLAPISTAIADDHPLGYRHGFHDGARIFDGLVDGTVGPYVGEEVHDHILAMVPGCILPSSST